MSIKMFIKGLLLKALILGCCAPLCAVEYSRLDRVFGEVGFGFAGGKNAAPLFEMRGVRSVGNFDFSLSYLNIYGLKAEGMKSDGAALPTIGLGVERVWMLPKDGTTLSFGGSLGFTMPNLADGVNEQADNDVSFILGGKFTRPLGRKYELSLGVRGFFFNTDSQLTTYGSHFETLSNGQAVEVVDEFHEDKTLDFKSVLFNVAFRWQ